MIKRSILGLPNYFQTNIPLNAMRRTAELCTNATKVTKSIFLTDRFSLVSKFGENMWINSIIKYPASQHAQVSFLKSQVASCRFSCDPMM